MAKAARKKAAETLSARWYSKVGNAAQIASACIGLFGFTIVILQMDEARRKTAVESVRSELADARKLYLSYSDATLKYPHLTEPDYDALMRNRNEYIRYKNFISHMLYAYDEILNAVKHTDAEDEAEWIASFELEFEPHHRYLCQIDDPRFFNMHRAEMQERLKNIKQNGCKNAQPLVEVREPPAK
jgi:hypothetical protein